MMAKKCDRCGKLHEFYRGSKEFKGGENRNLFIDRDTDNKYWSRNAKDLCPECMRELVDWFEEGKHEQ